MKKVRTEPKIPCPLCS